MEDGLLALGAPVLLLGWIVMQVLALRRLSGGWRVAAWVPALAMAAAVVVAVVGVLGGSNLAPIWVVFALPLCFAWLALLWLARGVWIWARRG